MEYFVSYYDYYQPEAYVPSTDTFIEKDSNINEQIDRMRHAATYALLSRRDVIIVASVSCIFGIGAAEAYYGMVAPVSVGQQIDRDQLLRRLVEMQYERNDVDFHRGTFRARGDVVEVFPQHEDDSAVRIEFFGMRWTRSRRSTRCAASSGDAPRDDLSREPLRHAQGAAHRSDPGIRDELGGRLTELRDGERLLERSGRAAHV